MTDLRGSCGPACASGCAGARERERLAGVFDSYETALLREGLARQAEGLGSGDVDAALAACRLLREAVLAPRAT